jgi:hypothetical protein
VSWEPPWARAARHEERTPDLTYHTELDAARAAAAGCHGGAAFAAAWTARIRRLGTAQGKSQQNGRAKDIVFSEEDRCVGSQDQIIGKHLIHIHIMVCSIKVLSSSRDSSVSGPALPARMCRSL